MQKLDNFFFSLNFNELYKMFIFCYAFSCVTVASRVRRQQ